MTVLYICRVCDLRFDPQHTPHTHDDLGWRCWHCMDADELQEVR
jgi:rubredoxin